MLRMAKSQHHGIRVVLLGLGLILASSAAAQQDPASLISDAVNVVSPLEGAVFEPGQTVPVVVSVAPGTSFLSLNVSFEGSGFLGAAKRQPPYEFSLTIPHDYTGRRKITVFAVTGPGQGFISRPVFVDIETTKAPKWLQCEPQAIGFWHPGQQTYLHVTAIFDDGSKLTLTKSTKMSYTSSNEALAIVSPEGRVTATGPGAGHITIHYAGGRSRVSPQNRTAYVPYMECYVSIGVPRTIDGDLNGDGVVDERDLNVIRNAFVGKTSAKATGPFDARDRNKDGIIDQRDVDLLRALCTRPNCATR